MKLPLRNNPSEMFVNLYIRSFHEMLGIFTFGFMSRIIVSNSVVITNNYNSPCRLYIQILGLDGIVYYTQTELISAYFTSIDFYHISYNVFICDVDIIYTVILLIVFI